MCEICLHSPCLSRCPNAPEPDAVFTCVSCGEGICVGDSYTEIGGEYYCKYCLDDMNTEELIELFGCEFKTATEDDIDDGSDAAYEAMRDERLLENG